MVWPILISVDVTPRISAAVKAAGHVSTASALTTPNLVTKRIDIPPPIYLGTLKRRPRQARLAALSPFVETCHDTGMDSNHNHYEIEANARAVAQKNAALPPRFRFASSLRLRLQPGIRIGTRARLARRRHRRGARSCRLQHRLAVRLLALEQILDLVAAQGFEFKQTLGQRLEIGTLLGQDFGGLVVALFHKTPDLGVDLLDRRLRRVLGARHRHPQENLVLVFAIGHGAELFR